MPDEFFLEQYRRKAALADPLAQAGRGPEFDPAGVLHVLRETIALLDLRPQHTLLDVGCAAGLLDIVLSAICGELVAVEPVPELASLARENLAACRNARVLPGHGAAIPSADEQFDRVLMLEVLQLVPAAEARAIFAELRRVTRPGGRIVISAIPDARRRDHAAGPYLERVRAAGHLSEAQKADITASNERASWYDPAELVAWWADLDAAATVARPSPAYPNAADRFHLVVSIGTP